MKKFDLKNIDFKNMDKRRVMLIVIGVLCIAIALYGLFDIFMDYKLSDDTYNEVEQEFVMINTGGTGESDNVPWYEMISVDLTGLQQNYADVVGWIFFEDGSISYPVVHGKDNNQYLHTTYDGKQAKAGSIFLEATHNPDFSDTHTLIYGHNMGNLSMFGRLKYYRADKEYYNGREYFQIHTGNEILRYKIFAYQHLEEDSFIFQEYFSSGKDLAKRLRAGSMRKVDIDIEEDDKIVNLSTCTVDDKFRFVVSAVLVEKYSITDQTLIIDENKE